MPSSIKLETCLEAANRPQNHHLTAIGQAVNFALTATNNSQHQTRKSYRMALPDAEAFSQSALAMISFLIEEAAPIAARRLPDDFGEASVVLKSMCNLGLEIAVLAQSALFAREHFSNQ